MNSQPEQPHGVAPAAPMLADIDRQPAVLRGLATRLDEVAGFCSEHRLAPGSGGRIVAFGSGDGWFAARSVAGVTGASGLEVSGGVGPALTRADRAVAISMSGNVDRTVEAAEVAQATCGVAVSLTNSDGGRLSDLGLPNISLKLPDMAKFLCGTSSFTATRAMLGLIAGLAQGVPPGRLRARLEATADAMDSLLPRAHAVAREAAMVAPAVPGLRYLSCGPAGIAVADYGAAKIVELSGTPVWSDDVEEFAHRQYWTMQRGEMVVMLPTSPAVGEIAAASAEALKAMDVRTLAIAPEGMVAAGDWVLDWPASDAVDPLALAAVATQLFGYHWAAATGFDPDRRMHLKTDTERFKTSRRLTRRSLLALAGDAQTAV
ncbi:MAG: hypothetical protein NXH97_12685 [Rhodobacteraceae bacterium]|nr:hypothetical protein [Paracoccaceae bacterium]